MQQCPKCTHDLTLAEQEAADGQCPQCGIYFAKFFEQARRALAGEPVPTRSRSNGRPKLRTTDGVPSYIKESLSAGETVEAVFRLHWIAWVPTVLWLIASLFTLGFLLPLAIFYWLKTRAIQQAVTSHRVIYKSGIISRRTEEMRITSIETVELRQGVLGRLLGFGNVRVTGRGSSDVVIQRIGDPIDVKRRIEQIRFD
ncbi:PH domain-containing protein [Halopseudomonas litoralis]|uniref:PH domain-containing protein n=1 Tax=Halopseudomonas litoralis TaxID=797277 RepID=A0A1H1QSI5_9GAMM|nr:PH domain-containing protein [Halopseudomonas litoralis]SDS26462.1 PH domain-containing protein [Halopseudomonas litoralis]